MSLEEEEPGSVTGLDLLQRVYRNPDVPLPVRMRAAIEALPYEQPKLSAVAFASIDPNSFARALDRAIDRSKGAKLIEGRVIHEE
jgi:hypothetical protein